jgi:hypothetical protein
MNRIEDKICKNLADRLELLEPGLSLLKTEYVLAGHNGAGGRIDILAKDRCGHFVIIEVKRSNQAARQTLNEIHKYAALFRIAHGLTETSVRIMVVSTEWHELRLPLEEFTATTPYAVTGISLVVDPQGFILSAERLNLETGRTFQTELPLSRCQVCYLFADKKSQSCFLEFLESALATVAVRDYVILSCSYTGANPAVIYPYAQYLCIVSPLLGLDEVAVASLKQMVEWTEYLDLPEENFICAIPKVHGFSVDDVEVGYPEKLQAISNSWRIEVAQRGGRLSREYSPLSDGELIEAAKGTSGGNRECFLKVASPQYEASWNSMKEKLSEIICFYPIWLSVADLTLAELAAESPTATVSVSAYVPAHFFVSVYALAHSRSMDWWPQFSLVVEPLGGQSVKIIVGMIAWNGLNVSQTLQQVIESALGDMGEFLLALTMGNDECVERSLLKAHHLEPIVVEWTFSSNEQPVARRLSVGKGVLKRSSMGKISHRPPLEFCAAHKDYLLELRHLIESCSAGLPEMVQSGPSTSSL